jgi:hypothetical protein
MHDHSTGRRLIQCRSVTSIVQKTHLIRASRLQRGHTFEEQFEFIGNAACCARNNRKRIRSTSAKEPCVAHSCFDHFPFPAGDPNSTSVSFDGVDVKAKSLLGQSRHFGRRQATSALPPGTEPTRHVRKVP